MLEFNKLCKAVEQLDPESYAAIIKEKSARVLTELALLTDPDTAVETYFHLVMASVAADGKLAEEEYYLIRPVFESIKKREVSYEEAKLMFVAAGFDRPGEYKKTVDQVVDLFGLVSDDVKADMITICLLVCAVDGKVSFSEKRWIKQLCR